MIREVLIWPHPLLSKRCEPVLEVNEEVRRLLNDMSETMLKCRGAGLAANQVGFHLRCITVLVRTAGEAKVLKLVNPRITKRNELPQMMKEGCLSLPGYYEKVQRNRYVTVEALDETGTKVEIAADGVLAHALQHEIDHLDGVSLPDHLSALKKNLVRKKFTAAKKKGLKWQGESVAPRDFTDPSAAERASQEPELLAEMSKELTPTADPASEV